MTDVFSHICQWLQQQKITYRHVHHEPTRTSADAARVRGEPLEVGGKAILMKVDEEFLLFVLSAHRKINSSAMKKHFSAKKLRFATVDELLERTGLVPGSVPPFGPPILPFHLHVDPSVLSNEKIAFNAGLLTDSVIMSLADYEAIAGATVLEFASPE